MALAAPAAATAPTGKFVGSYVSSGLGYPFSLVFSLVICVCATASVPLVDVFASQEMNIAAMMALMPVGPITNWGTTLVFGERFGGKTLFTYVIVVSIMALALGYCFCDDIGIRKRGYEG